MFYRSILDGDTYICLFAARAHSADITDIAVHQEGDTNTVVTCGRDRTIQVFQRQKDTWGLAQTLDDHTASVTKVLLLEGGTRLLSCSTDRTIVMREQVQREVDGVVTSAFIPVRTLTLKASPLHMTQVAEHLPHLVVSTMDRQIMKFDLNTGKLLHSFRTNDENGETVMMDSISLSKERGPAGRRLMVGVATTDKSIRVYDMKGELIDKEWGHTEGVTDVALLETGSEVDNTDSTILISTGTDGTVMIWEFNPRTNKFSEADGNNEAASGKSDITAARAPVRKVLSKNDLSEYTTRPAEKEPVIAGGPGLMASPPRMVRKRNSALGIKGPPPAPSNKLAISTRNGRESPSVAASEPTTPLFTGEFGEKAERTVPASPAPPPVRKPVPGSRTRARSVSRTRSERRSESPAEPNVSVIGPPPVSSNITSRLSRRPSHDARAKARTPVPPPPTTPTPTDANATVTMTSTPSTANGANSNATNGTNSPTPGNQQNMSSLADTLLKTLKSFREGLSARDGPPARQAIRPEVLRELEKELGMTTKDLGVKPRKPRASTSVTAPTPGSTNGTATSVNGNSPPEISEAVLARLLDSYSERLVRMVDERIEQKLGGSTAASTREGSEVGAGDDGQRGRLENINGDGEREFTSSPKK